MNFYQAGAKNAMAKIYDTVLQTYCTYRVYFLIKKYLFFNSIKQRGRGNTFFIYFKTNLILSTLIKYVENGEKKL